MGGESREHWAPTQNRIGLFDQLPFRVKVCLLRGYEMAGAERAKTWPVRFTEAEITKAEMSRCCDQSTNVFATSTSLL